MSVKNRLKEFIKNQKLTISAFEKSINVSNGYVNSISKGIGGEVLMSILEKSPNLNINWLLTGIGDMLKDDGNINDKEIRSQYSILHDNIDISNFPLNNQNDNLLIEMQTHRIRSLEKQVEDQEQEIEQLKKELSLVSTSKVGSKSV